MTAVSSATAPSSEPKEDTLERLERAKSLDVHDAPTQPLRNRVSRLSLSGSLASLRRRSRSPRPRQDSDAPPPSPRADKSPKVPQSPMSPTTKGAHDTGTATPAQADQLSPPSLPLAASSKEPSVDVAGPRHKRSAPHAPSDILAGDPIVYSGTNWPSPPAVMIRERIGTNGVVRPLEPQSELSAFSIPEEHVGVVPETALARYINGKKHMDAKYSRELKRIARKRARIAKDVPEASAAHLARLQHYLERHSDDKGKGKNKDEGGEGGALNAAILGANWSLAWALDSDEHPPPSSIVARRDTREARVLALIADQAVIAEPSRMNANSLWSATLQLFTVDASKKSAEKEREEEREREKQVGEPRRKKRESVVGHHTAPGGEPKSKRRTGLAFWRLRAGKEKSAQEARQPAVNGAKA